MMVYPETSKEIHLKLSMSVDKLNSNKCIVLEIFQAHPTGKDYELDQEVSGETTWEYLVILQNDLESIITWTDGWTTVGHN